MKLLLCFRVMVTGFGILLLGSPLTLNQVESQIKSRLKFVCKIKSQIKSRSQKICQIKSQIKSHGQIFVKSNHGQIKSCSFLVKLSNQIIKSSNLYTPSKHVPVLLCCSRFCSNFSEQTYFGRGKVCVLWDAIYVLN